MVECKRKQSFIIADNLDDSIPLSQEVQERPLGYNSPKPPKSKNRRQRKDI